jgi:hypothetical protein
LERYVAGGLDNLQEAWIIAASGATMTKLTTLGIAYALFIVLAAAMTRVVKPWW